MSCWIASRYRLSEEQSEQISDRCDDIDGEHLIEEDDGNGQAMLFENGDHSDNGSGSPVSASNRRIGPSVLEDALQEVLEAELSPSSGEPEEPQPPSESEHRDTSSGSSSSRNSSSSSDSDDSHLGLRMRGPTRGSVAAVNYGCGKLCFYETPAKSEDRMPKREMVAICRCQPHQFPQACRRTRTVNESMSDNKQSQGRPLGELAAWLSHTTDTRRSHQDYEPSHAVRRAARRSFVQTLGELATPFLSAERLRRGGEGSEPE